MHVIRNTSVSFLSGLKKKEERKINKDIQLVYLTVTTRETRGEEI